MEFWSAVGVHYGTLLVREQRTRQQLIKPVTPNGDHPCNINAYLTNEVMRIKDMITQCEFSCYFNDFLGTR